MALSFWTDFNPDTALGIKLSDIRPPYLGRISIVADKGRSNREQIATFPADDDHLCAPPVVIKKFVEANVHFKAAMPARN
ncbi:MAG: hypothetical protein WDN29_01430 [Methylovirgula sp.]